MTKKVKAPEIKVEAEVKTEEVKVEVKADSKDSKVYIGVILFILLVVSLVIGPKTYVKFTASSDSAEVTAPVEITDTIIK
ncbi:MAG: hypothetical protein WC783_02690 [Candidatus Paceibacterota bacterium]|jgi:hypothetical protein